MTTLRSCIERCFGDIVYGDELFWHQDLKPHTSGEFSIAVVQANSTLEDQGQVAATPFGTFIGVYDGHGGPEAARFVNNQLFPNFCKSAMEQKGVSADVMRKAIVATEEEFLRSVERSFPYRPQIASVGTCCLVGAVTEDMLYVANLGDSRAVLGRCANPSGKDVVAERLTCDHNVSDVEIRKELKQMHPDDSDIVVHTRGVWRIKGIIQVRFFGSSI
ncbi:probable protein phosphatase 2C 78, partial [Phalaenopsis equestris]|uniref:probable protein phosphatase 2C 78 n=1 Tax=Phalaenopsis equestris TaxID=78828 RepID=UPI0009E36997